ncbi:uncharacterized protein LOC142985524 [Anticarsia gemmatalis]|uniref:uncharacterized protein LOC142985524 n=1 Tax=Anticarsia gemmatalis TaxID=129554 RepID=UPI003F76F9D5
MHQIILTSFVFSFLTNLCVSEENTSQQLQQSLNHVNTFLQSVQIKIKRSLNILTDLDNLTYFSDLRPDFFDYPQFDVLKDDVTVHPYQTTNTPSYLPTLNEMSTFSTLATWDIGTNYNYTLPILPTEAANTTPTIVFEGMREGLDEETEENKFDIKKYYPEWWTTENPIKKVRTTHYLNIIRNINKEPKNFINRRRYNDLSFHSHTTHTRLLTKRRNVKMTSTTKRMTNKKLLKRNKFKNRNNIYNRNINKMNSDRKVKANFRRQFDSTDNKKSRKNHSILDLLLKQVQAMKASTEMRNIEDI